MKRSSHMLFAHDVAVLDRLRLASGLTLAAPGAAYDRVWIRDNCYVGLAMWHTGQRERALRLFQALLRIMGRHAWKIDWIMWEGKPSESYKRLHPRYDTQGFEIPEPWGFAQNDAIGLLLWCLGWIERQGATVVTPRYLHLVQKLVWYLCALNYWQDLDNGVWEEIAEVHASSVACCVQGLESISERVSIPEYAIPKGRAALHELGTAESTTRAVDLAQLTMVWPLGMPRRDIVEKVESTLVRRMGVLRYLSDEYHRGSSEAEWTMGFPWLGLCWNRLGEREKAERYLYLTDQVRLERDLPEAYIPEGVPRVRTAYVACGHTPLAWSHALAAILREEIEGPIAKPHSQVPDGVRHAGRTLANRIRT